MMRVLVAGWFSIEGGGATAGDMLVRDLICGELDAQGIAYDIAQERALGAGVDWFRVAPSRYTHLLFVCGPVAAELAVGQLIERFANCRRVAVNVSLVGNTNWRPFDLVLERDGAQITRADLAILASATTAPVVALVRTKTQLEYPGSRPHDAHAAFDRLLANREAATFVIDTVLDADSPGRRSAAEVSALITKADVVLTTRLHGLVLAISRGVPAVAIDSVIGGAKVIAQARALAWPAAMTIDELNEKDLARHYDWCLTPDAQKRALSTALAGAANARRATDELGAYLARR
jgi:Polysaccharide pyruvyl transferase